jgi:hypothetical protein
LYLEAIEKLPPTWTIWLKFQASFVADQLEESLPGAASEDFSSTTFGIPLFLS